MTMHLVGPYLSTTKYSSRKKKPNSKQLRAQQAHEEWLRKKGLSKDQRLTKFSKVGKVKNEIPQYLDGIDNSIPLSNKIGNGIAKPDKMSNLHLEKPEVIRATLRKKSRIDVAYNKGPLMYVTDDTDPTTLGTRSRRG